jgi:hypothetical protein
MSKPRTNKKATRQRSREELSDEQLGKVSGGIGVPLPRDERPTESITFVYHKIAAADLGSLTPKK